MAIEKQSDALRAIADLRSEGTFNPYRRYVLERIEGELVFRQPEVDAIVEDAIDDTYGNRPLARRIIKLP
jgi:hypothetical protein